jgi:hypothetical protein
VNYIRTLFEMAPVEGNLLLGWLRASAMMRCAQWVSSALSAVEHSGRRAEQSEDVPGSAKKEVVKAGGYGAMQRCTRRARRSLTCGLGWRSESEDSVVWMAWISARSLWARLGVVVGVRGGVMS